MIFFRHVIKSLLHHLDERYLRCMGLIIDLIIACPILQVVFRKKKRKKNIYVHYTYKKDTISNSKKENVDRELLLMCATHPRPVCIDINMKLRIGASYFFFCCLYKAILGHKK